MSDLPGDLILERTLIACTSASCSPMLKVLADWALSRIVSQTVLSVIAK